MGDEVRSHGTKICLPKSFPSEVDAGVEIETKVQVSCTQGCNLVEQKVRLVKENQTEARDIELMHFREGKNETEVFPMRVPIHPGIYSWSLVFPRQKEKGVEHLECSASFSFTVQPHTASIAVWDIPSPIPLSSRFGIKLGVKCSGNCKLAGEAVEIYDHRGAKASRQTLKDALWPGSTSLYWIEIPLKAPDTEDDFTWSARFVPQGLAIPHREVSSAFGFRVAPRWDHTVTIQARDKETKLPLTEAYVRMNIYRTYTDEAGQAILKVPQGTYQLSVYQQGHEIYEREVLVDKDLFVRAELLPATPVF